MKTMSIPKGVAMATILAMSCGDESRDFGSSENGLAGECAPKEVPVGSLGDVDCDGIVGSFDALRIVQELYYQQSGDPEYADVICSPRGADVNEDGKINLIDSSLILAYDTYVLCSLGENLKLGLAPGETDEDGDSISDAIEEDLACLDASVMDMSDDDEDGDSLSNIIEVAIGTSPCVRDTDRDGCNDGAELGDDPSKGGLRDPQNPYDYFNPTRDGVNRTDDILMVVDQYFIDVGDPLYNPGTDRSSWPGGFYDWNLQQGDGLQRVNDVLMILAQYMHDCSP